MKTTPAQHRTAIWFFRSYCALFFLWDLPTSAWAANWRQTLSDQGVDLALTYKHEFNSVLSGGLSRENKSLGNLDFKTSLDFTKMGVLPGASALLYILGDHGGDPSRHIGDAQVSSNIETVADTVKIYEAWVQQVAVDGKLSLLAGLHDLNSEFYVTETAGLFFNSSFGVSKSLSQSGVNGPSIFPTTSPALRIRVEPTSSFYLQTAAFGAIPGDPLDPYGTHVRLHSEDGFLMITEIAWLRNGKLGGGYWTYTQSPDQKPNSGAYLLADQTINGTFSAFLRIGGASTASNKFGLAWETGTVATGIVPSRPRDRLGLGLAQARSGDEYRLSEGKLASETTLEINYRWELHPGIALQPDLQHIWNPGASPEIPDATAVAVRFELTL